MWISLDAAYLGSSWICPEFRPQESFLSRLDSISINFSKALLLGVGGSLLFIKDKAQFTESMSTTNQSNFSFYHNAFSKKNDITDYRNWIIGADRRSSSLRFFYFFKYYGVERLRIFVRSIDEKAKYLAKLID